MRVSDSTHSCWVIYNDRLWMLPRYVNFSTTFSRCPLMVMLGLTYGVPGARWCFTSVFFFGWWFGQNYHRTLKTCKHCFCLLGLVVALSAQSSVNRNSLTISVLTLVFAWSLLRLKTEPSELYRMSIPLSEPLNASKSITENIILKRVGARTHPC